MSFEKYQLVVDLCNFHHENWPFIIAFLYVDLYASFARRSKKIFSDEGLRFRQFFINIKSAHGE